MSQEIDVNSKLYKIRHSLAHVLAQAVLEVRPDSKLGFGPPIDDGFYYDFILTSPITEEDFKEIEKKMKHIIKQNQICSCLPNSLKCAQNFLFNLTHVVNTAQNKVY